MKQPRWCGMTAKTGTVLSGVFSIMATHLSLIFERKHLQDNNCTEHNLQDRSIKELLHQLILCRSYAIVLFLAVTTMLTSAFLLYSVYAQHYRGLMTYVLWIICETIADLVIKVLTNELSMGEMRYVRWSCWGCRACMQGFWMFFVVTYAQVTYKGQTQGYILAYNRRISMGNREAPRCKSKILSFVRHYSA
ncbi:transmembrane protein 217 [Castor canadensis]|jgi:hypothetical protein|uniref:Transmembrane protein 217 n=1 Tax=Castor canadensis TaxID=51338 RepID=A0A8C0WSX3_CASCN|nr:transmembrane protein 217 [Castor canadensis]